MNAGNHYQNTKGMGAQKISNIRTQFARDTFLLFSGRYIRRRTQAGHIERKKRGNRFPGPLSKGFEFFETYLLK